MKKRARLGRKSFVAAAWVALCVPASLFAGTAADSVRAHGAFARAVAPGQTNSAAFMELTNEGRDDHALVAAESNACRAVELHTHLVEDGMMKMRPVDRIELRAGGVTRLEPGGLHVMLIGLERALSAGDEVGITLVFEDGSRKRVTAPVRGVRGGTHRSRHEGASD
jgi:copper(I)-binding protein